MSDAVESHRVTLANREAPALEVREDETILSAAGEAGVALPSGCRAGHCISCAARLVAGRVAQPGAVALSRAQVAEGFVLLCVARPRSDVVLRVGAESQRPLFGNPFLGG